MIKVILAVCFAGVGMAQIVAIQEVAFTRAEGYVVAFSPAGRVHLQAREVLLNVPFVDGKRTRGDLLVVFDPATKYFLWEHWTRAPSGLATPGLMSAVAGTPWIALFSGADGISWWWAGMLSVDVHISKEIAADLDNAFQKAIAEVRDSWDSKTGNAKYRDLKAVSFADSRFNSFWEDPADYSAAPKSPPRIEDISRVQRGYQVRLSKKWTGEVTIGDDMKVKEQFHPVEVTK